MVFAATVIIFTGSGIFGIAQGQVNNSSTLLTSQQKAAICSPNNPKLNFVNTTESKLCGIPKTVLSNISNMTRAGPAAPSSVPTLSEPGS